MPQTMVEVRSAATGDWRQERRKALPLGVGDLFSAQLSSVSEFSGSLPLAYTS